jgi:hypothetical protein
MQPELGRDASVAIVLIAAIVALATGTIALGAAILAAAGLVFAAVALIRSRAGAPRHSRAADPRP